MEASYCRPINVFNFSSLWQQSQCQWKVLIMMDYRVMTHFPIFQVSCLHTNRLNNSKFRGNFGQRSNEKWMAWEALAQGSIFTPVSCELWESLLNLRVRESEEVLRDYFFSSGQILHTDKENVRGQDRTFVRTHCRWSPANQNQTNKPKLEFCTGITFKNTCVIMETLENLDEMKSWSHLQRQKETD